MLWYGIISYDMVYYIYIPYHNQYKILEIYSNTTKE